MLLGVAIAGPGATEAIHEAVLAIKMRAPIAVLADTIHAFPTTARVLGGLFVDAARRWGCSRRRLRKSGPHRRSIGSSHFPKALGAPGDAMADMARGERAGRSRCAVCGSDAR